MRAGNLDRTIVIQAATTTDDGYGNQVTTWADFATLRAQLVQASTTEFIRAFGSSYETAIIFRTRWIDGVTLAHRVIYDGLIHQIKEITEIGRRRGLELRTQSLDEAAP